MGRTAAFLPDRIGRVDPLGLDRSAVMLLGSYMVTQDAMTDVFQALANEHRRRMMDLIRARPGIAVGQLAAQFDVSRITVMKHLGVLEAAGLVVSRKEGVRRHLFLNTVPLQEIHERWTSIYTETGARRVLDIRDRAEALSRKADDYDG